MNYSVSELGGFAGSALVGYTKELIKKRDEQSIAGYGT